MRTRLLIIAVALASTFVAQHADAKSSTKSNATSKKHKKHHKKTSSVSMLARTV